MFFCIGFPFLPFSSLSPSTGSPAFFSDAFNFPPHQSNRENRGGDVGINEGEMLREKGKKKQEGEKPNAGSDWRGEGKEMKTRTRSCSLNNSPVLHDVQTPPGPTTWTCCIALTCSGLFTHGCRCCTQTFPLVSQFLFCFCLAFLSCWCNQVRPPNTKTCHTTTSLSYSLSTAKSCRV